MEVHLTMEKEAQLYLLAMRTGKNTAQVVEEAVDRLLEYRAYSRLASKKDVQRLAVAISSTMTT